VPISCVFALVNSSFSYEIVMTDDFALSDPLLSRTMNPSFLGKRRLFFFPTNTFRKELPFDQESMRARNSPFLCLLAIGSKTFHL